MMLLLIMMMMMGLLFKLTDLIKTKYKHEGSEEVRKENTTTILCMIFECVDNVTIICALFAQYYQHFAHV